ncbi:MAG TPA: hypothetical protein VM406_09290 [Noviherbaspirillum sp.]|nr:hypothetical protein [Noviherbaspirillum sp.]
MHPMMKGALAGAVATIPMTIVMSGLFRRLPREQQYPLPPVLITSRVARHGDGEPALQGGRLTAAALAAHFAYGALTGAMYPLLERTRALDGPPALTGPAYGLAVWAASYLGWIPAARILTPATRHPTQRNALMWTAHAVWGAALAAVCGLLQQREPASQELQTAWGTRAGNLDRPEYPGNKQGRMQPRERLHPAHQADARIS